MPTIAPPIRVERVRESRLLGVDLANVPFSTVFSDHMFFAEYEGGMWSGPKIRPFGPLQLSPSITSLQYGISVFEGMKAHRLPSGEVALFRPRENARRLNRSAARLSMPDVPEGLFLDGLKELLRVDGAWVPPCGQGALYIRPSFFSVDESIRVVPAERYVFVIFTFPFGAYFSAPVDVLVSDRYVRAFPGGTGDGKPAGNYAPALLADRVARDAGFHTVLWLDGMERKYVEECGVMNIFFVIGDEVVTPNLTGTILPGVTRDSVLALLREMGVAARERPIAIEEVATAHDRGLLRECFGTGTAVTVSHVGRIRWRDKDMVLPAVDARTIGPAVRDRLVSIATGRANDVHGWLERV